MIKLMMVLCAESTAIDKDTGHVSVFNIVNHIKAGNYPYIYPQLTLHIYLLKDEGDYWPELVTVKQKFKKGDEIFNATTVLNKKNSVTHRISINLRGYVVEKPGIVETIVEYDYDGKKKTLRQDTMVFEEFDDEKN